jgi:hypothetical protein
MAVGQQTPVLVQKAAVNFCEFCPRNLTISRGNWLFLTYGSQGRFVPRIFGCGAS